MSLPGVPHHQRMPPPLSSKKFLPLSASFLPTSVTVPKLTKGDIRTPDVIFIRLLPVMFSITWNFSLVLVLPSILSGRPSSCNFSLARTTRSGFLSHSPGGSLTPPPHLPVDPTPIDSLSPLLLHRNQLLFLARRFPLQKPNTPPLISRAIPQAKQDFASLNSLPPLCAPS